MPKSGFLRLLPAAFLVLTFSLHAAAPSQPLPPQLAVHVSVKSPLSLLEAADEYVSAVTAGSVNALPPGILPMLAQIYLPVPLDSWNAEGSAHLLFLPSGKRDMDMVFVLHADDFEALTEALDMRGWDVGEVDEDAGYEEVVPIETPDGKELVMVNLDDGMVAIAEAAEHVHAALGDSGWRPEHHSEADVFVNYRCGAESGGQRERIQDRASDGIRKVVKTMADRLASEGVSRATADGLAAAVEKYLPLMAGEIDNLENVICELRLDGDKILLDFGGKFASGGVLGEIAGNLAKAGPAKNKFALNVPTNVISFSIVPSATTFLADAPERIGKLNGDLYGMIFPGIGESVTKTTKDFFDSNPAGAVTVNYAQGSRQFSISMLDTAEPGAAMQSFIDTFEIMNEAWDKALTDKDYLVRLVSERVEEGGLAYMRTSPQFANPDKFRELLDRINSANNELKLDFDVLSRLRMYFATQDGMLMMGMGDGTDAEFREAFATLKDKAAEPMLERKSAKSLRDDLTPDQGGLGYLDADGAFLLFANQAAAGLDSLLGSEDGAIFRRALEKTKAKLQNRGALLGVSMGAEDGGWLLCRLAVPVEAANTILLDYETFERFRAQEAALPPPRGGAVDDSDDDDDDDGDDSDDEDEDEDVEITADDDAA